MQIYTANQSSYNTFALKKERIDEMNHEKLVLRYVCY